MDDLIPEDRTGLQHRDVQAAQNVLDAWLEDTLGREAPGLLVPSADAMRLRGLLIVWAHDLRAAGIAEGHRAGLVQGRVEARQAILDALEDL